ncbi:CYTH and CHAD domain-containing protein [Ornithinimicrobium panacihumi]|uniref:CYTH and CHAD domain-containing protein n=1 Tax=Ornithinimicrobium panacihumi TaxID=2008449 RepID=UPI003F8BF45B
MRQVEIEQKFDIPADAPLPALGGLVEIGPAREHRMRAVYLDTQDLLLVRSRITLRRREGGGDEGWHLKLPRPDGSRLEIHAPLGDGPGRTRVPEGHLAEVVEALGPAWPSVPASTLLPAAVLSTRRYEVDLLDEATGEVLAQLCDDTVTALPAGKTWREIEVELVGGDEDLLASITEAFQAQGLTPAAAPSKLARAVGDRPERAAAGLAPEVDGPARDVLHAYLAEQVAGILGREADVRVDVPDAVHKSRVATRRLRSALRTFRRLLDREITDPLRDEVKWYAAVLGEPRDAEVMKEHITGLLDDLDADQVVGPVRDRVKGELDRRHAEAHAALVEVMDSERYLALTDRLVDLLAEPPWRGRADKKAEQVLPDLVAKAIDRARRDWDAAQEAEGEERLHLLHETRKRAKAVRYAAEALAPTFGAEAQDAAETWEQVTEALGALQDSVVAAAWITDLSRVAQEAGEPTFTYGVLVGEESTGGQLAAEDGELIVEAALDHPWP